MQALRIASILCLHVLAAVAHAQAIGDVQPPLSVVGYDATLQGGLFNRTSPYAVPANEVTRVTFQSNQGIVMSALETGSPHWWGGVRIGMAL
jgi:hypothetical protein